MKEAAQAVASAVDAIFSATQKACHDEEQLGVIGSAATTVTASLDAVMNKLREGPKPESKAETSKHEDLIDSVVEGIELLLSSLGRPADMIKQVSCVNRPVERSKYDMLRKKEFFRHKYSRTSIHCDLPY